MKSPYGLPSECVACHLRADNFFCALSPQSLQTFNQIKHGTVFPEGAVIFVEGQKPRGIFVLCQGRAKLCTTSRGGKTFILRIVNPGEVLGLDAVVSGKAYEVTARTMQPCQMNFVNRENFLRFLKEHGDACLRAAQHLSGYCQDAYEVVRSIGLSHSVSGRLAKFLLASATNSLVTEGVIHAKLVLTHEEIAQLTGTSRETITRILIDFRRMEIAQFRGTNLIIHNKLALERLAAA